MSKYLVMTAGQTFLVEANSVSIADNGTISLWHLDMGAKELICALPHGASVIKEESIQKPDKPSIHRVN